MARYRALASVSKALISMDCLLQLAAYSQRIAASRDVQVQVADNVEQTRRMALGTTNRQLFWRGLCGCILGGMVFGFVTRSLGADQTTIFLLVTAGHFTGAWSFVTHQVRKGRRAERKAAYLAACSAAAAPAAAPAPGTWAAGVAAMAASTLKGDGR